MTSRAFSHEKVDEQDEDFFFSSIPYEVDESLYRFFDNKTRPQQLLALTVTKLGTNQGSGKVIAYADEAGEFTGLEVNFSLKGKKSVLSKGFDELRDGERMEYKQWKQTIPALIVKKGSKNIYPQTGGEFTFSILSQKPKVYKNYTLYLRKESGRWVVKSQNGKILKSVDLTPNLENFDWDGTFSAATFN